MKDFKTSRALERRLTWTILGVTALGPLAGCQALKTKSQREKPEANWNQVRGQIKRQMAAKQLDSGLFEEAARSAREAVALAPESPEAYVLLALANIQRNKIVSAQQAVDAARTRGVRSGDLAYTEGILLEQRNQLEAAHRMYAEAEDFDPTNVDYFTARVECLISLNRLEEAAQLVAHASDRFDDEVSTVVLSARLALLRGDDATALSFIAKVRSTAAKDPTIAESFGLAMLRLQRYEEAVSLLRPAVDRLPEARAGGAARRGLAEAYLQRGQHAQALDVLGDYSRGQPRDARAQVLTAKAALGCADYSMALEALERAARAGADRRTVVLLRATAHWLRGSSETAISELEAWLGASPTDAEACCLRGEIALAANCTAEAMAYFEQAREIDPDSTWAQAGIRSIAPRSP